MLHLRSQLTGESVSCVWPLSCCPWSAVLYSVYLPVFRSQLPGEPVSCVWPLLCCSWSALYCISTCLDPSYLVSRSAESDLYHAAHDQLYCISTSLDPSYLVSQSAVSDLYRRAQDQLYCSEYLPVFRSQLPGEPVSSVWPLSCCPWSAVHSPWGCFCHR